MPSVGRRKGPEDFVSPFSPDIEPGNKLAFRAYQLSCFSLIPFVGLLFGPLAVILGLCAYYRRGQPNFTAPQVALAAMILGGISTVCNYGGLLLILLN